MTLALVIWMDIYNNLHPRALISSSDTMGWHIIFTGTTKGLKEVGIPSLCYYRLAIKFYMED